MGLNLWHRLYKVMAMPGTVQKSQLVSGVGSGDWGVFEFQE